ncbi:gamma carbonic anhydrase family protein [Atopobiaceae bacterium HCP3S3_F7]
MVREGRAAAADAAAEGDAVAEGAAAADGWREGGVFVAEGARVVGDVSLAGSCSVWYNAVIRADEAPVTIGAGSNVQDNAVIHVDEDFPVTLGEGVTVGHAAILHGCSVGDNSLVGMGAIVLDGATVGRDCIVGAGALVTQGTEVPDGHLALGSPARVVRALRPDEVVANRRNAETYVMLAQRELDGGADGRRA